MGSGGGGSSTTTVGPTQEVRDIAGQIPGVTIPGGDVTAGQIAPTTIAGTQMGAIPQIAGGDIQSQLQQSLLDPSFAPTTASEEAFLGSVLEQTQGQTATRGLGPATQGALAQDLAPALMGLRQQRIQNLQAGAGLEQQRNLAQAGFESQAQLAQFQGQLQTALAQGGITSQENQAQAANVIQAAIANGQLSQNASALEIQQLLAQAGLLQPTVVGEQQGASGTGALIGGTIGAVGGGLVGGPAGAVAGGTTGATIGSQL